MSSSKSLPSSGTESEIERMTNFKNFGLQPYTLDWTEKNKSSSCLWNSVSDLASSNDVVTNVVDGRTGNKTWCKCECCAPMVFFPQKFLRFACQVFQVYRVWTFVDQIRILWYDFQGEKTFLVIWFLPIVDPWQIRIKVFYHFNLRDYRFF